MEENLGIDNLSAVCQSEEARTIAWGFSMVLFDSSAA